MSSMHVYKHVHVFLHCCIYIYTNTYICYTELDPNKKLTEKDLKNIAPNIATDWKDVGIQLGIKNLDIYEKNTDLTEEKFKRTVKLWLRSNAKPVDELLDMFHEGLKGIELFRAAEEFKENAEEFKMKHKALKQLQ